jgi:hypothetical protein
MGNVLGFRDNGYRDIRPTVYAVPPVCRNQAQLPPGSSVTLKTLMNAGRVPDVPGLAIRKELRMAPVIQQDMQSDSGQMQQTALRLMRCLGGRAARDYCLAQDWTGLYEQICLLDGRRDGR